MGASNSKPQQDQSSMLEHNDSESSTALHSANSEPVSLNLGRRVFLSHSGRNKDFVRRLNKDLCRSYHGFEVTFFDEDTLPKGKPISMEKTIVEAARGSALGVLVLTDDFFMSTRNPMLELQAFVTSNVPLLPLFLTLSVEEFKEKKRWDRWEKKWKEWAAADDKLVIENWRTYLESVRRYNGLEFCKIAPDGREDIYIDEVVKQVARIFGPAVPMCGADVYGKGRLCRLVDDMYKKCASTFASLGPMKDNGLYVYDLVGIHGFLGLGKTTLCRCLCDFYFQELNGKVCYVDVGLLSQSRLDRMQHVLSKFDMGNTKDIHSLQLDSNQVENLLKERLSSMKDPVFLAIDNVLPERECQKEVLTYLGCKFPKGSKIIVTSKTESTLRNLTSLLPDICSLSSVIEYMPALELNEARDIFMHEFPALHNCLVSNLSAVEGNIQRDVDACVNMCTIFERKWYHPLMLQSLAAYVKWDELMPSLDWKGRLAKLASEGVIHKNDAWDQVFQVFNITYGLLAEEAKKVFLDLALCYSATNSSVWCFIDLYEWIELLHRRPNSSKREMEKILLRLHNFCFIVKEKHIIKFQGLMVEFGKHITGADPDRYVVLEDVAHWLPVAIPRTARHVSIARCRNALQTLDLSAVKGVEVLHLVDNVGLEEVLLSCSSSAPLRSMIVHVPAGTALCCIVKEDWIRRQSSILCLDLRGNFKFSPRSSTQHSLVLPDGRMDLGSISFLGCFRNLEVLTLDSLIPYSMQSIDLAPCANLKRLALKEMQGLKSIRGPESSSRLETVIIKALPDLELLAFMVLAHSKTRFSISDCVSLQRISLIANCTTPSTITYAGCAAEPAERWQKDTPGLLRIFWCPCLAYVEGLSQYTGAVIYDNTNLKKVQKDKFWTETFVGMVKDAGSIDFSQCKATVVELRLDKYNPAAQSCRLEAVSTLALRDTQHIGLLIPALCQAKLGSGLRFLTVECQQGAGTGCGCDQNAPNFSTLPLEILDYRCPQVRDLGSLNALARNLYGLTLKGCRSVEVWPDFAAMTSLAYLYLSNTSFKGCPDFAAMTSLGTLDLSYTSLKGWPAGVQLLPYLGRLFLKGCKQLPAKELIRGAITSDHCCGCHVLADLRDELIDGTRDRRMVADALAALSAGLGELFEQWSPEWWQEPKQYILWLVLDIMYKVWFGGEGADDEEQKQYIRAKMRGLLISDSFLELPFRVCRSCLIEKRDMEDDDKIGIREIVVLGIALVGGVASSACSLYRAFPAVNDHLLRNSIVVFLVNSYRSLTQSLYTFLSEEADFVWYRSGRLKQSKDGRFSFICNSRYPGKNQNKLVKERVEVALYTMAREAGLEN